MNEVNLEGRVCNDLEPRFTNGGDMVLNLRLAIEKAWIKDGVTKKKTTYISTVVFGSLADLIARDLSKGEIINLRGEMVEVTWKDRATNADRSRTEVHVNRRNGHIRKVYPFAAGAPRQPQQQPPQQQWGQPQQPQQQYAEFPE